MVDFYRHDIVGWMDGTEGLDHLEYRAYHVICELIYLNEGPITFNPRGIAGRCNMRLDHLRRAVSSLVEKGKLRMAEDLLSNDRCGRELDLIRQNRRNAAKGGRGSSRRAKNGSSANANDAYANANASSENVNASSANTNGAYAIGDDDKPLKYNDARTAPLTYKVSLLEESRVEELTLLASEREVPKKGTGKPIRDAAFERFKAAYPRRDGSQDWAKAREVFDRHLAADVDAEDIIGGAQRFAADVRRRGDEGTRFVKQARTWLNGKLWQEFPATAAGATAPSGSGKALPPPPPDWPSRLPPPETCFAAWSRNSWPGSWGFPPGDPSSLIPPSIAGEWRKRIQQEAA